MIFKVMLRVFVIVALIVIGFGVVLFFVQDGMIYLPRRYTAGEVKWLEGRGLKRLDFETGSGKQGAFYQSAENGVEPERIWLVFGGNGGRAADYEDLADEEGDGFLFVDYPGYGLCEGRPSPKTIDETVDGAVERLRGELGFDEATMRSKLCVVGHSLGAAVGLRAAVRHGIDRVVLLAPFTTMKEMAAGTVGGFYANVLRHRFDNVTALGELVEANPEARVVILSGSEDREISPTMGKKLAELFPENGEFRLLEGVGHNDLLDEELPAVLQAMSQ